MVNVFRLFFTSVVHHSCIVLVAELMMMMWCVHRRYIIMGSSLSLDYSLSWSITYRCGPCIVFTQATWRVCIILRSIQRSCWFPALWLKSIDRAHQPGHFEVQNIFFFLILLVLNRSHSNKGILMRYVAWLPIFFFPCYRSRQRCCTTPLILAR